MYSSLSPLTLALGSKKTGILYLSVCCSDVPNCFNSSCLLLSISSTVAVEIGAAVGIETLGKFLSAKNKLVP